MASSRKVKDHVQLQLSAVIATTLFIFTVKYLLRRAGRPDLAGDL